MGDLRNGFGDLFGGRRWRPMVIRHTSAEAAGSARQGQKRGRASLGGAVSYAVGMGLTLRQAMDLLERRNRAFVAVDLEAFLALWAEDCQVEGPEPRTGRAYGRSRSTATARDAGTSSP